jgi:hypothetical protein
MNENIKMVFSPLEADSQADPNTGEAIQGEDDQAAEMFTRYADATWERIKQDDLNEEALDSASNIGTCVWHYYWDNSKTGGKKLEYIGEMEGEVIDAINYFPGNPQNRNVQQQPWNIITHRDEVENVRQEAKENGLSDELIALIKPDSDTQDQGYDKAQKEMSDAKKVTVITKYYKKIPERDPFVYFVKVAGNVVIRPETNTEMKLYPLEVMQWKRRKKSIYGVGDTEGLIPNQKSINFLIAMQIKSVQDTGWPRMLVKKDYIKQIPTNTPGEILFDNSPGGQWGAQYMMPGTISGHAQQLVDNIMSYTKEVAGANENALGEQTSRDLNATAITMLQKAAGIPIESIKRRFYQSMENIGRIWEEFWKVKYNTDRMVTLKNEDNEPYSAVFNGSAHQDTEMSLKIDIGPGSSYSETLMMSSLDKLFDSQQITLEQYLKYAPRNVIPFKDRLLKDVQQQQQMDQENEQLFQQHLQSLTPEEQQAFASAQPEQQQQIKDQFLQTQAPQQPQQAPMM